MVSDETMPLAPMYCMPLQSSFPQICIATAVSPVYVNEYIMNVIWYQWTVRRQKEAEYKEFSVNRPIRRELETMKIFCHSLQIQSREE